MHQCHRPFTPMRASAELMEWSLSSVMPLWIVFSAGWAIRFHARSVTIIPIVLRKTKTMLSQALHLLVSGTCSIWIKHNLSCCCRPTTAVWPWDLGRISICHRKSIYSIRGRNLRPDQNTYTDTPVAITIRTLPSFIALDLRVDKTFTFVALETYVDLLNAYKGVWNHLYNYDYTGSTYIDHFLLFLLLESRLILF